MIEQFAIAGRHIGPNNATYVIAEAGVNHNGSLDLAFKLVDAAINAGADAVKFQTFDAEALVSREAPKAEYQLTTTDPTESQFAMLKRLQLAPGDFSKLAAYCNEKSITFLSTPFDEESVNVLLKLHVPALKVPSGEVTNHLLLRQIGVTGLPVILSTGMSTMYEVEEAVRVLASAGCTALSLLHCVSNYPAEPRDVNLNAMRTMREKFNVPVGFSDHTLGIEVPIAAVAIGASIVEKHLTLDKTMEGPDHAASLEPDEFRLMTASIRNVEAALGNGIKEPAPSEAGTRPVVRRSLVLKRGILSGTQITLDALTAKRPAGGISPDMIDRVVGMVAATDLAEGSTLLWDDLK